jgi:hypothetical protein
MPGERFFDTKVLIYALAAGDRRAIYLAWPLRRQTGEIRRLSARMLKFAVGDDRRLHENRLADARCLAAVRARLQPADCARRSGGRPRAACDARAPWLHG